MTALGDAPATRVPGRPALRVGRASVLWRPRSVVVVALLLALTVLAAAAQVASGPLGLSVPEVLRVFAGGGSDIDRFVVLGLRLPRALAGALAGAALGLAGALLQSVLRNPLASPDLLGITMGASAAAVAVIVFRGTGPLPVVGGPTVAVLGGLATGLAVYAFAWRRGVTGLRLVLVGIGLDAALRSVTTWLLVRADLTDAARATTWLAGSLNARGWDHAVPLAAVVAACTALLVPAAPGLAVLRLGPESARSLGLPLQRSVALLLGVSVVLASAAVAAAGPVAFVALVAPQVALRLVHAPGPPLAASALTGALLVVTADLVARVVLPVELPVGIVTALLGAPYLLYLLARRAREVTA